MKNKKMLSASTAKTVSSPDFAERFKQVILLRDSLKEKFLETNEPERNLDGFPLFLLGLLFSDSSILDVSRNGVPDMDVLDEKEIRKATSVVVSFVEENSRDYENTGGFGATSHRAFLILNRASLSVDAARNMCDEEFLANALEKMFGPLANIAQDKDVYVLFSAIPEHARTPFIFRKGGYRSCNQFSDEAQPTRQDFLALLTDTSTKRCNVFMPLIVGMLSVEGHENPESIPLGEVDVPCIIGKMCEMSSFEYARVVWAALQTSWCRHGESLKEVPLNLFRAGHDLLLSNLGISVAQLVCPDAEQDLSTKKTAPAFLM